MKKALFLSLALILLLGIMSHGTSSYFSDRETSAGNTFTAWVTVTPPGPNCHCIPVTIWVDENNIIHGGPDDGQVYTGTLNGTNGADVILGTIGNDIIYAGNQADIICAHEGNNTIYAGNGTDIIYAGDGDDYIEGGEGKDIICAGGGDNTIIDTGGQPDFIITGDGDDYIAGGHGGDIIYAGDGNDTIYGEEGTDIICACGGNNEIYGGMGIDIIITGDGNDTIYGGNGNDEIYAGDGVNTIYGEQGNDTIFTGNGNDIINGGANNDSYNAGGGTNNVTNCENLIAAKSAICVFKCVAGESPATDWDFTGSFNFTIPADGGVVVFTNLAAGTYTITETPKPGYTTSAKCCCGVTGTDSLTFSLVAGSDNACCLFINTAECE